MKNSYAMFAIVVYFYEQSRTILPKIMTHRRESRCKSRALHAGTCKCNGRSRHTDSHAFTLSSHASSLSLSLSFSLFVSRNFFPSSESKFPIATLSKILRYDRNVKHCFTHDDQLKFYFR